MTTEAPFPTPAIKRWQAEGQDGDGWLWKAQALERCALLAYALNEPETVVFALNEAAYAEQEQGILGAWGRAMRNWHRKP